MFAAALVSVAVGAAEQSPSNCYRIAGDRVSFHSESYDPQFRRTHTVDVVIDGADAETFVEIEGPPFTCSARDRSRVYWHAAVIEGADPASFRFVGGGYAEDARRIYYRGAAVAGARRATFEWFGFEGGREPFIDAGDHERLYRKGSPMRGLTARPEVPRLRVVDRNFFVDGAGVYRVHWSRRSIDHDLVLLAGADPASFRLIGEEHGAFARDEHAVYLYSPNGRRFRTVEPEEIETFVVLNRNYARDSRRAYFQGEPIPGADLPTFEADGPNQAKDRNRFYDARGRARVRNAPSG